MTTRKWTWRSGAALTVVFALTMFARGVEPAVELPAADRVEGDQYGFSTAMDNGWAAVGSPRAGNDGQGSVLIYRRHESIWQAVQKLEGIDYAAISNFGTNLVMEADTLAVTGTKLSGSLSTGMVVVFRLVNGAWVREQTLNPPALQSPNQFGEGLDLDGDTLVIGDSTGRAGRTQSGIAHVFERSDSSWSLQQTLQPDDPDALQNFGENVAVEGETVVVSARGDTTNGRSAGAVYVFSQVRRGWSFEEKVFPTDPDGNQSFGESVDLEGGTLVVGAEGVAHSRAIFAGAVFVFTRDPSWKQQARLISSDPESNERLGTTVVLQGRTLIAGARSDDIAVSDGGSIMVFTGAGDTWTELDVLTAPDAKISEAFGRSLALDNGVILAGLSRSGGIGSAFSFDLDPIVGPSESYIVPKTITLNVPQLGKRAPDPGLRAKGTLDTGTGAVDLTLGGALTIGSRVIRFAGLAPQKGGKSFLGQAEGATFEITPDKKGSSKAAFALEFDGCLAASATENGALVLRYLTRAFDASCTVQMTDGTFKLSKSPNTLLTPALDVRKIKIGAKGPGRDTFSATLGFESQGFAPNNPLQVTVGVGATSVTIQADLFELKGQKYVFKGNEQGVTGVTLDYAKGTAKVKGKKLSLGLFADGPNTVLLRLNTGVVERSVAVRCTRKGKNVKY